jgi:L-ascorbate metabolism protein UlaG (beta-lactamase superfamily)
MKIKWNGHASFTVTSENGTVIVTDPYNSESYGDELSYEIVRDRADGVLVSHEHPDHCYIEGLSGSPRVFKGSGEIKGIIVTGIRTFHDKSGGSERGNNMAFRFTVDGITICFLGDLGHILSQEQLRETGHVDILLIPVGGTYTLDTDMAAEIVAAVRPKMVIPMHFKTKKCSFPITGVEIFLSRMANVKRPGKSEIEVSSDKLPAKGPEVWVLDHAC